MEGGVVADCSGYLAWRGRSEEDAGDDFDAEAAAKAAAAFAPPPAAPHPSKPGANAPVPPAGTFARFGG